MDRRRRLAELLLSTFRFDGELRRFFAAVSTDAFMASLPSPPVSDATLAHDGVAALEGWGLVCAPLWEELRRRRPGLRGEIDEVARAWSADVPEGTAWLTFGELSQLANLVLCAPFVAERDALFARIPARVREAVPVAPGAVGQVLADLDALNRATEDGASCWIEHWIDNARSLCGADWRRAGGLDYFLACVRSRRPIEEGLAWGIIGRSPNPLCRGWPRFSRPLRYTLALASHLHLEAARTRPSEGEFMATRYFFAALRLLEPAPVGAFVAKIPPAALGELPPGAPRLNAAFLAEPPQASHCLRTAITRLLARVPPGREITAGDLFLDVAKYGTGESVQLLRNNGIYAAELDRIAAEIGFHGLETGGAPDTSGPVPGGDPEAGSAPPSGRAERFADGSVPEEGPADSGPSASEAADAQPGSPLRGSPGSGPPPDANRFARIPAALPRVVNSGSPVPVEGGHVVGVERLAPVESGHGG